MLPRLNFWTDVDEFGWKDKPWRTEQPGDGLTGWGCAFCENKTWTSKAAAKSYFFIFSIIYLLSYIFHYLFTVLYFPSGDVLISIYVTILMAPNKTCTTQ